MKFTNSLRLFAALSAFKAVSAANSFAGSNLGLQSAGMKVPRVWLDGASGEQKGTAVDAFPDLEPKEIGTYDDTVLERLDTLMLATRAAGIKLLISMHSFNALQAGDVYGKQYGTGNFYQDAIPQQQFDARLTHVLNHKHTTLGKPWSELSEYIFAFEAQNEASPR
ncbi:hypothetical protein HWV62_36002 [Athelia sp. TMB]|nr:hypothetical protein HWV62_36002 [Athelia sp. TMB]